MKKRNLVSLSLPLLILSCASLTDTVIPELSKRTLRISRSFAGLEYQYRRCAETGWFGNCKKIEMVKEKFDLTDEKMRNRLVDMGFTCRVRDLPE